MEEAEHHESSHVETSHNDLSHVESSHIELSLDETSIESSIWDNYQIFDLKHPSKVLYETLFFERQTNINKKCKECKLIIW